MSLPRHHPAFAAHVTDPIYDDHSLETAPFGSDEGADMLWEWEQRRDEVGPASTIAHAMGTDDAQLDALISQMSGIDHLDQAAIVRGAVFTLLRLTGRISLEDRERALRSIEYESRTTADPHWLPADARDPLLPPLYVQQEDLLSWRSDS